MWSTLLTLVNFDPSRIKSSLVGLSLKTCTEHTFKENTGNTLHNFRHTSSPYEAYHSWAHAAYHAKFNVIQPCLLQLHYTSITVVLCHAPSSIKSHKTLHIWMIHKSMAKFLFFINSNLNQSMQLNAIIRFHAVWPNLLHAVTHFNLSTSQ